MTFRPTYLVLAVDEEHISESFKSLILSFEMLLAEV